MDPVPHRERGIGSLRGSMLCAMLIAEFSFFGLMPLGDFFVALGTLMLAGVTGWLALLTKRDVEDTHRLAGIALESHEARYEPFLVVIGPDGFHRDRSDGILLDATYALANVGVGPALDVIVQAVLRDPESGLVRGSIPGYKRFDLIRPGTVGETVKIENLRDGAARHFEEIVLVGSYFDRTLGRLIAFPTEAWLSGVFSPQGMDQLWRLRTLIDGQRSIPKFEGGIGRE
jgi:hypothetical protein